jgi:branched-chain amino acid transport system ATP-binding protein
VRFDGHLIDGYDRASTHAPRACPHLSTAAAVRQPQPADNMRIPLLYTVAARGSGHSAHDIEARCIDLLREVGLDGKAQRLPRELTQVEMRKLELARAMAAEPKLLIADESMAGLTHSEVEEI